MKHTNWSEQFRGLCQCLGGGEKGTFHSVVGALVKGVLAEILWPAHQTKYRLVREDVWGTESQ